MTRLRATLGSSLAGRVARTYSELQVLAHRDHAAIERLRDALDDSPICADDRAVDLNDTGALVDLQNELSVSMSSSAVSGAVSVEPSR